MKTRLDQALVERGLAASRSQARDLIRRGAVSIAGQPIVKPAAQVGADDDLNVVSSAQPWVSRGGLKLAAALHAFGFDPTGRVALDVGASTGGFSHVLLQGGASRVFAVDVGHGQFSPNLAADPRVVLMEATDARSLDRSRVPDEITAVVADVSFISVTKALPAALALAVPGAWAVILVKPQFELTPADIGKGGIVRDAAARDRAMASVRHWIQSDVGWRLIEIIQSPIEGGSGNIEFLLGASRE